MISAAWSLVLASPFLTHSYRTPRSRSSTSRILGEAAQMTGDMLTWRVAQKLGQDDQIRLPAIELTLNQTGMVAASLLNVP